jgi:hypothetical protein
MSTNCLYAETLLKHKAAPCLTRKAAPGIRYQSLAFLGEAGRRHMKGLPPDMRSVLFISYRVWILYHGWGESTKYSVIQSWQRKEDG